MISFLFTVRDDELFGLGIFNFKKVHYPVSFESYEPFKLIMGIGQHSRTRAEGDKVAQNRILGDTLGRGVFILKRNTRISLDLN